jgi:hypothetical protein
MFGMPTAQLRFVTARIPGSTVGVEMVEMKGIDRKPARPKPQDPGGMTLAPADSNIIGARVRVTVADTERAMKVYRDVLHFQPQTGSFGTTPLLDLMGLKGAEVRQTNAQLPGSALRMEFIELKGVSGTPIKPRLQDPGATRPQGRDHARRRRVVLRADWGAATVTPAAQRPPRSRIAMCSPFLASAISV